MIDLSTNKKPNKVRVCTSCGKEFTLNLPEDNHVCNLILKQDSLGMCDDCYKKYLKEQEELT